MSQTTSPSRQSAWRQATACRRRWRTRPRTPTPASGDYRDQLSSRRWDAAPLRNPEAEKTDPRIAVAAILILAALTLARPRRRLRQWLLGAARPAAPPQAPWQRLNFLPEPHQQGSLRPR